MISAQRKYQQKRKSLGLCQKCNNPVSEENKNFCEYHRNLSNKRSLDRYYAKQEIKAYLKKEDKNGSL